MDEENKIKEITECYHYGVYYGTTDVTLRQGLLTYLVKLQSTFGPQRSVETLSCPQASTAQQRYKNDSSLNPVGPGKNPSLIRPRIVSMSRTSDKTCNV